MATLAAAILREDSDRWERIFIDSGLESMQHAVGGLIEFVSIDDERISLVANEEGKINGMAATAIWVNQDGEVVDALCGPLLALGGVDADGYTTGLTDEAFLALQGHLKVIPIERRAAITEQVRAFFG